MTLNELERIEQRRGECGCISCQEVFDLTAEIRRLHDMLSSIACLTLFYGDGVILARNYCRELGIHIQPRRKK